MKKTIFIVFICVSSILLFHENTNAQSAKPYSDGPVWTLEFIKVKTGMNDIYLKDLSEHWAKFYKTAKDQGIIMDYKILGSDASGRSDWDLMLMTEVKNYAALDGLGDKMNALARKVLGSDDSQHQSAINRNDMREIIGGKLAQEIIFK
ncbi:MAG: hypothetical protein LC128_01750 [Chitinophagales bacterium]|nr:hypothetical protein [Chitinophagales bacterium]